MDFDYNYHKNKKSTGRQWLEYIGGFVLIYIVAFLIVKLGDAVFDFSSNPGRSEEHGYFDFVGIGIALVFIAGYYVGYQAGKTTPKSKK
jgi:hypothetical protein